MKIIMTIIVSALILVSGYLGYLCGNDNSKSEYLRGTINGVFYHQLVNDYPDFDWNIQHMNDSSEDFFEATLLQSLIKKSE